MKPERTRATRSPARARLPGCSRLALLLVLFTGCAALPPVGEDPWSGLGSSLMAGDAPAADGAGQRALRVTLEQPTPQRQEELQRLGVQLPRVSREVLEPRAQGAFVERRLSAVGFGILTGGYLLYCEGLESPVLVPESHVDFGLKSAEPLNAVIYPDRETALADVARAPKGGPARYAWYWGAGGALIVPTVFSPASTPLLAQTMVSVRQELSVTVERQLEVVLLNMVGTRVLSGIFARVMRLSAGPALRPLAGEEGLVGRTPAPRQPVPRPASSTPAPAEPVPAPVASAPTSARPASAPASLEPSQGLVQALAGKNPTPQVAPGTRLPQDTAVSPKVPEWLPTDRPIGASATQNAQVQRDIQYLESIGATNFRVNQQQLTLENGQRVGINRPDLQFDYNGRRYHVEYDTPASGRGAAHQLRTTSNDPNSETILLIVP